MLVDLSALVKKNGRNPTTEELEDESSSRYMLGLTSKLDTFYSISPPLQEFQIHRYYQRLLIQLLVKLIHYLLMVAMNQGLLNSYLNLKLRLLFLHEVMLQRTSIRVKEMRRLAKFVSTESHDGNENTITINGHW